MTWNGRTKRQMKVLESLDDLPTFRTEAEEADFWATHELGQEILDQMGPMEPGILPPPRCSPTDSPTDIPRPAAKHQARRVRATQASSRRR